MATTYSKPPLTIPQQVELLKSRGMIVADEALAAAYLSRVNYYRFAGYARVFRVRDVNGEVKEGFVPGTSFEQICQLYSFDELLRRLLMTGLERIEINFRTALCNITSIETKEGLWYTDSRNFSNKDYHNAFMADCTEALKERKREDMVKHYKDKYGLPFPPCWVMIELLPWGAWCKAYSNIKKLSIKKKISGLLTHYHYSYLESWIVTLKDLRNHCAHHGSVWNRRFPSYPKVPEPMEPSIGVQNSVYTMKLIIQVMLDRVGAGKRFSAHWDKLMEQYPLQDKRHLGMKPEQATATAE